MTHDGLETTGRRLALGNDIPAAIALIEPDLTLFNRTMNASRAMLPELIRLGRWLRPRSANMAPLTMGLNAIKSATESGIERRQHLVPTYINEQHLDRPTTRLGPPAQKVSADARSPYPRTAMEPAKRLSPAKEVVRKNTASTPSQQVSSTRAPASDAHPPNAMSVSPKTSERPESARTSINAAPIADNASGSAVAQPKEASTSPPTTNSPANDQGVIPSAESLQPHIAAGFVGSEVRTGALGPGSATRDTTAQYQQHVVRANETLTGSTPSQRAAVWPGTPSAAGNLTVGDSPAEAGSEPRQGTIVLDGAQLGRWMIDQLERYAARPGAMITGIDPRMSPTYPGAPTGS